ncbi:acetyl-CoA carboxylase biotin carboxyl carrier protein [Dactylosporangium sp. CA-092794]|uniref:acetyl-CoA carboxylase biotin carboxyl carrier protein n=1 Tax=Dactylosporangium sp. CA-092794 TaxID=3239929 RepID=UPI003D913198
MNADGARETEHAAGWRADERGDLAALDAVHDTVLKLLAGVPLPPARLRLRVGEVDLEVGWDRTPDAPVAAHHPPAPVAAHASAAQLEAHAPAAPVDGHGPVAAATATDHLHAPTVGTFYVAPEPGAPPFVEPGGLVAPGQQVGIVEAMKLMIPVEADRHCRILRVLVGDGTAVEFGQRLFAVAPVDAA